MKEKSEQVIFHIKEEGLALVSVNMLFPPSGFSGLHLLRFHTNNSIIGAAVVASLSHKYYKPNYTILEPKSF